MGFIIFLLLFVLIEWYIFNALKVLIKNYPSYIRRGITGLYWMISLGFIVFILFLRQRGEEVLQNSPLVYVQSTFFIYYLSKIFLLALLFIDDFRRLLAKWFPRLSVSNTDLNGRSKFLIRLGLVMAALPFSTLLYGSIRNAYRYKIFRKKVSIKNLADSLEGLKIIQISDIHAGSFFSQAPLIRAVKLINEQEADLVFFTGDLVNDKAEEMDDFLKVLDKISAKHGVFSVFGNHDYGHHTDWPSEAEKSANLERLKEVHRQLGWNLLLNENQLLDIKGASLAVIGVENFSTYDRFPTYGKLDQAYEGTQTANLRLLMSHDPSHWEAEVIKNYKDIAITFSGHTHGFQFGVEIPGWIHWSPAQYMYKQWAGLYQQEEQYIYVNRGLGCVGYSGRVGILPEITVLEITKAENT